ncbi:hypothetical protein OIU78_011142 [Salix suchowensis]|nr:hypothetical protein OIU78_011142 [Salix suchowensis]
MDVSLVVETWGIGHTFLEEKKRSAQTDVNPSLQLSGCEISRDFYCLWKSKGHCAFEGENRKTRQTHKVWGGEVEIAIRASFAGRIFICKIEVWPDVRGL